MKTIEDEGIKQVEALKALKPEENQELESTEGLFSKKMRNIEIKNEINNIKKIGKNINWKDLIYKANFQQYETIRFFLESIYTSKINIDKVEMDQINL